MQHKKKIIRAATIPLSLDIFCKDVLRELSRDYNVVALSSPGSELDTIAMREGVTTVAIPMRRHISPLRDMISLIRLIRFIHKEKPWLVHSMTPKAGLLCMIAAKICNVPHRIHTFTGLIWPTATGIKQKILIATDRLLCSCATIIIPEGEGVKRDIISAHITNKPLNILAHGNVRGIDLSHYRRSFDVMARAKELRDDNFTTFIFVGRLVRDKGITELVNAFTKLHRLHNDTKLLLVGPLEDNLDPLPAEISDAIATNNAICAVGMQSDIRPWLAASDIFVFPSYREGFPNVVIEAGAMDLPAIVSDINGANEIIINKQNGLIIPSHNTQSLFEAMLTLYRDKELRTKLSQNARKLIASRYDCHIVRQALYTLYATLK